MTHMPKTLFIILPLLGIAVLLTVGCQPSQSKPPGAGSCQVLGSEQDENGGLDQSHARFPRADRRDSRDRAIEDRRDQVVAR